MLQCKYCRALVSEIEAVSTCPVCEGELVPVVEGQGNEVVALESIRQPSESDDDLVEEPSEPFDNQAPTRHPANPRPEEPELPQKFMLFKVHTNKVWEHIWVRAETVTQAREAIFASSVSPQPLDGSTFWGVNQAFYENRGAATIHIKAKDHNRLPGGVSKYLDRTGVWVSVRT